MAEQASAQNEWQIAVSAGLRIFSALPDGLFTLISATERLRLPEDRNEDHLLHILDWLALLFTREPTDTVATSLSLVPASGAITVHVALAGRAVTDEDRKTADQIVQLTKQVFARQATAEDVKADIREDLESAYALIAGASWPAFQSKLGGVRAALSKFGVNDQSLGRLDDLINLWAHHRQQSNLSFDSSDSLTSFAQKEQLDNVSQEDALRMILRRLLSESEPDKLLVLKRTILQSELLQKCDFFVACTSPNEGSPESEWNSATLTGSDATAFAELQEALQYIDEYHTGVARLIQKGMRMFRRLLGRSPAAGVAQLDDRFTITFVDVGQTTSAFTWPSSSDSWVRDYVGYYHIVKDLTPEREETLHSHVDGKWKKGEAVQVKVDVGIALALYLQRKGIFSVSNVIGLSAPPCFATGTFFKIIKASSTQKWLIRDPSNELHLEWALPLATGDYQQDSPRRNIFRTLKALTKQALQLLLLGPQALLDGGDCCDSDDCESPDSDASGAFEFGEYERSMLRDVITFDLPNEQHEA